MNYFTDDSKKYITNLCEIVLEEDYNIQNDTDPKIVTFLRLFRFIPVYFEITKGCYGIFDDHQRILNSNEFNNIISKINNNYVYKLETHYTDSNFMSFISFFNENVNKPEMKELSDLIFKYYKDIM